MPTCSGEWRKKYSSLWGLGNPDKNLKHRLLSQQSSAQQDHAKTLKSVAKFHHQFLLSHPTKSKQVDVRENMGSLLARGELSKNDEVPYSIRWKFPNCARTGQLPTGFFGKRNLLSLNKINSFCYIYIDIYIWI